MNRKITVVALCGKAGAGKDTLLQQIMRLYPNDFHEIISCTTRPPREGEVDGINYYFLTVEEFTEKLLNGEMLEATEFNGWHYGTALGSLFPKKVNIGVFNPAGIACLLENDNIDLHVFEIEATPKTRLLRQLNRESNPDVREILRRYYTDEEDFKELDELDFGTSSFDRVWNEQEHDLDANAKWIASWTLQVN